MTNKNKKAARNHKMNNAKRLAEIADCKRTMCELSREFQSKCDSLRMEYALLNRTGWHKDAAYLWDSCYKSDVLRLVNRIEELGGTM